MASNQYVNKVIYGDQSLIDLTGDTVTAANMRNGITAHDASGATITGTIPTKTASDLINNWLWGHFGYEIPEGYYTHSGLSINSILIKQPSSGTNSIGLAFPNNSNPQSMNDWTQITFSVDANGDATIEGDTIPASGVSF